MHDRTLKGTTAPDVVGLGVDLLYRMVRADVPFEKFPMAAEAVNPAYRAIWVAATWAFQCHTYLRLIDGAFGPDIGKQVEQVIVYGLNRYGEAGDQLERFLTLTRQAVGAYNRDLDGVVGDVGVTFETYLAIVFLVRLPDSPYFVGPNREGPDIPDGTVDALSRCLGMGAKRLTQYYQRNIRPTPGRPFLGRSPGG